MARPKSLSLAFVDKRPVAAARILATMDAADAAAFLEDIPTRYVALILAHMGAWSASAVLAQASANVSAAALRALAYSNAAAILRLMAPEERALALDALPVSLQRDFRMSLSYPDDTVGAHMTTSIMTQRPYHSVADARAEVRRAQDADAPVVFVVTDEHQMAGVVSPDALLRHPGKSSLQGVMDSDVGAISARARISSVAADPAWDAYTHLPVVSRDKVVIGALARKSTGPYRGNDAGTPVSPGDAGLIGALSSALAATVSGLAQLGGHDQSPTSLNGSKPGFNDDRQKPKSR